MLKLEIVLDHDRLQRRLDTIRIRFPAKEIATSSFYCIYGCYVDHQLTEEEKTWLHALADAKVIIRFRCKAREDR